MSNFQNHLNQLHYKMKIVEEEKIKKTFKKYEKAVKYTII
jgi:hypothetical protein